MTELLRSTALLLVLLNPFLLIIYLIDVVEKLNRKEFLRVLIRAGLIATSVFWVFAVLGDTAFSDVMHVRFAAFQVFGGIVFLIIGLQFVFRGPTAIEILRGESEHLAGAIAMPVLIGPGTISASVVVGKRHDILPASAAIIAAVVATIGLMVILKAVHDIVRPKRERLIQRYIEIGGRITALVVGTISVQMIMEGLQRSHRIAELCVAPPRQCSLLH
jgi:small neutral amino acid transporter SnatA (MarC family)